ncbi:MAG: prephenate/arogenate dehydrogenase family protein [Pseudomonadota bacterium]
MFKQITIIGFGLIGSSIARGIQQNNLCERIICVDQSKEVCKTVMELGLAYNAYTDAHQGVQNSDLIIFAVPVGVMGKVLEQCAGNIKPGAIISDTGSVKQSVIDQMQALLPEGTHLIPAHPIAGTEFSGPEHGFAELFHDRWCVLTPTPNSQLNEIEKVTNFWEALGSNVEIMEPKHHDLVLGITSHLPHLIAYTIVGTATDLEDDIKSEVVKFSASGFRDFTRIAASDPTMWRDVFMTNKDAVLEVLQRFTEDLTALQRAIRKQDGEYLYRQFAETRDIRRAIVDAGQANYVYPDQEAEENTPAVAKEA